MLSLHTNSAALSAQNSISRTQSADGASTATDRTAMQAEYNALTKELSNTMQNTSFGGTVLFSSKLDTNGNASGKLQNASLTFQIGASSSEKMDGSVSTQVTAMLQAIGGAAQAFDGGDGTAGAGGTPAAGILAGSEISDSTGVTDGSGFANLSIDQLSKAIDAVGTLRSALGAVANRLDHVYNNLSNISTNTQAATGRIMDTDFAAESSNMTSSQMLLQAGTAMLKQSNSTSSLVMSLLQ